jgi:hypothetical protein
MDLDQLKSVWQQYDAKLQKALTLNVRFLEIIEKQKVKSKLTPLFVQKVIETLLHGAVIALLLIFLAGNLSEYRYAMSAAVLLAFYGVAIKSSISQMLTIGKIDYSDDIVSLQKHLATLQADNLNYARLSVLCMPTFLAYPAVVSKAIKDWDLTYFSAFDIIAQSNGSWWSAQFVSSVVLIPLCIWAYTQLTRNNIHKPWVRNFIAMSSGRRVTSALDFVNELESLKRDAN